MEELMDLTPNLQKMKEQISKLPTDIEVVCKKFYENEVECGYWHIKRGCESNYYTNNAVVDHPWDGISTYYKKIEYIATTTKDIYLKVVVKNVPNSDLLKKDDKRYAKCKKFVEETKQLDSELNKLLNAIRRSQRKAKLSQQKLEGAYRALKNQTLKSKKYDLEKLKKKIKKKINNEKNLFLLLKEWGDTVAKYRITIKCQGKQFISKG